MLPLQMRIVFPSVVPVSHWTRLHQQLGEEQYRMGDSRSQGSEQCQGIFVPVPRYKLIPGGQHWQGAGRNGRAAKGTKGSLEWAFHEQPWPTGSAGMQGAGFALGCVLIHTDTSCSSPEHRDSHVTDWETSREYPVGLLWQTGTCLTNSRESKCQCSPQQLPEPGVHWSHVLWSGHGCSSDRATWFGGFLLTVFQGWSSFVPLQSGSSNQVFYLRGGQTRIYSVDAWTELKVWRSVWGSSWFHWDLWEISSFLFKHRTVGRVCGWIHCEIKSGKMFLSYSDAKLYQYQTISSWNVLHLC